MSHPMRMTRILAATAFAAVLAAPAAAQQTPPEPGTPRPFTLPPAREITLPNGMRATLVQYGTTPKVAVQLITRVGNLNEDDDQVWLADMVGDLMQEGTTTRTAQQIARDAAAMGGSLAVGVGAHDTYVGGEVLSEFAPDMVDLIADVAINPAFPEEPLARIKATRTRQIAVARTQPGSLAVERFRQALYPGQRYGISYPDPERVQGYTTADIRAFHEAEFGAARSELYVVGRFDEAAVEAAIRDAFGGWERGPDAVRVPLRPVSERAVHLVERPGAVQSTIYMGLPVLDPSNPDWVAFQVMNSLLGGSFASRITSNIREAKGYTYSPYSTVSVRQGDAYWAQVADVTTPVTGASLHEIFFEIDRLANEPPTAEELRGIQNYLAGTFVLQNSSRGGIVGQLAYLRLHGLPPSYLPEYVNRIYAVTPQEISRIVSTYLDPSRMTIVVVGDRAQVTEQLQPYGTLR
jgi:zinc protease